MKSYCIIVWKFSIVKIRKKNNRIRISEVGTVSNSVDEKKQIKLRSFLDCRLSSTILFCIRLFIETQKNTISEIGEILVTKTNTFDKLNLVIDAF